MRSLDSSAKTPLYSLLTTRPFELTTFEQLPQATYWTSTLDGSTGHNRAPHDECQIQADHDQAAIQVWLSEYREKSTTYRAYLREAERLLLWSILQKEKAFSDLTRADMEDYFVFLQNPQPTEHWCGRGGGRHYQRGCATWKPFTGGLSPSATRTAITILKSLLEYLTCARYLNFNPLSLMRRQPKLGFMIQQRAMDVEERIVDIEEWQMLLTTLDSMSESTPHDRNEKLRLKMMIYLFYFLGARVSDIAQLTWDHFKCVRDQWWCFIVGKGDKLGKIPVNDQLLQMIKDYRDHWCKAPLPQEGEGGAVIFSWHTRKNLSARHIQALIKQWVRETLKNLPTDSPSGTRLAKFSAHWLRHLSASMQDRAGIDEQFIQKNHRHSNISTTRQYIHKFEHERHEAMKKLRLIPSINL